MAAVHGGSGAAPAAPDRLPCVPIVGNTAVRVVGCKVGKFRGKTAPIWQDMADTGADRLSIDNAASLTEAKAAAGHRVRLMGNVPPSEVMLLGTPAEVRAAVRERVRQTGDNPRGLIVASDCSLPVETPFANIDAMLDAVREIGWPVHAEKL